MTRSSHLDGNRRRNDGEAQAMRAILFDADGGDRVLSDAEELPTAELKAGQLLWVDLHAAAEHELRRIAQRLSLPSDAVASALGNETNPALHNCGSCFWVRVIVAREAPGLEFSGDALTLVAGKNLVVTLHRQPLAFIDALRERESAQGDIGALGAASFAASLLDWHLSSYFDAVSRFEMAVERLEVDILRGRHAPCLEELRDLRKAASRLRRMLAPHRVVFAGLARPDFRPGEEEATNGHFHALERTYERAMDMVENARDLVVGSFELFSSQTALVTNESMRTLTFATVVIGLLAVIAGVLGMNFQTP
ncbi:MAG: hypothetical protein EOP92_16965, partial [Lysobacteraceae bacterium]